jgi:hypothetical protein
VNITKGLDPNHVKYLVIHCAATPPEMDIGRAEIDRWHRERGMARIGYHLVIRRNGTIEEGRPLDVVGAHAVGFNLISVGVCLVGGVTAAGAKGKPEANYTVEQMEKLRGMLSHYEWVFRNAAVIGHRDLPSAHARLKACPSFDVRAWLAADRPTDVRPFSD